ARGWRLDECASAAHRRKKLSLPESRSRHRVRISWRARLAAARPHRESSEPAADPISIAGRRRRRRGRRGSESRPISARRPSRRRAAAHRPIALPSARSWVEWQGAWDRAELLLANHRDKAIQLAGYDTHLSKSMALEQRLVLRELVAGHAGKRPRIWIE